MTRDPDKEDPSLEPQGVKEVMLSTSEALKFRSLITQQKITDLKKFKISEK